MGLTDNGSCKMSGSTWGDDPLDFGGPITKRRK
jgi:hypothetical protein